MAKRSPVAAVELTADEEAELCRILGGVPAGLDTTLAPFAAAAMREFVDMFTGQPLTSIADLRQRRLVNILLALPPAELPKDDKIARWFGLTTPAARSFLRNTLARNRNKLRSKMAAAAKAFIAAAAQPGGAGTEWEARFANAGVIDMLNDELANVATVRSPILKKSGTFDTYTVANGSMIELNALYP